MARLMKDSPIAPLLWIVLLMLLLPPVRVDTKPVDEPKRFGDLIFSARNYLKKFHNTIRRGPAPFTETPPPLLVPAVHPISPPVLKQNLPLRIDNQIEKPVPSFPQPPIPKGRIETIKQGFDDLVKDYDTSVYQGVRGGYEGKHDLYSFTLGPMIDPSKPVEYNEGVNDSLECYVCDFEDGDCTDWTVKTKDEKFPNYTKFKKNCKKEFKDSYRFCGKETMHNGRVRRSCWKELPYGYPNDTCRSLKISHWGREYPGEFCLCIDSLCNRGRMALVLDAGVIPILSYSLFYLLLL